MKLTDANHPRAVGTKLPDADPTVEMINHDALVKLLIRKGVITSADAGMPQREPAKAPEPSFVKIAGRMVPAHLAAMVRAQNRMKLQPPKAK